MKNITLLSALLLGASTLGCSYYARSAEDYSKDTKALLKPKSEEIKACYDEILKKDSKAEGVVAVNFTVEAKTGAIKDVVKDAEKTTASDDLAQCVLSAMEGLVLDPPDQRDGVASFSYEFKPKS